MNVLSETWAIYAEKVADSDSFEIRRGYAEFVKNRPALVIEDVLTTGGSVRKVVDAVRAAGGHVIGVGALWNRGGVTLEDTCGEGRLVTLINQRLQEWNEAECPLCCAGVPVNTEVGHGRKFLESKQAQ